MVDSEEFYTRMLYVAASTILWFLMRFFGRLCVGGGWPEYKDAATTTKEGGELTEDKREARRLMFDLYVLSFINATAQSSFGIYKLFGTSSDSEEGNVEMDALLMGYFIHDTIALGRLLLTDPATAFHHVCGLIVCYTSISSNSMVKHVPKFVITELSTVFLDIRWFYKDSGRTDALGNLIASGLFVMFFFLLRVCWLPYMILGLFLDYTEDMVQLGVVGQFSLVPIAFLQIYWFKAIAEQAVRQMVGKKKKAV